MKQIIVIVLLFCGESVLVAEELFPRLSHALLPVTTPFCVSVNRYGVREVSCGPYVYPPLFWSGLDTGVAVRKKDGVFVFLSRDGKELFEIPPEWNPSGFPWAMMRNASEGHFICRNKKAGGSGDGRSFFFVNHRGERSRVYDEVRAMWNTDFVNGLAVVVRDGTYFLLDHDYRETAVCAQNDGVLYPFFPGPYAVLHLRSRALPSRDASQAYGEMAVVDRGGQIVFRAALAAEEPAFRLMRLASSKGCLVPVVENGRQGYRYYLLTEKRFADGFFCTYVAEEGFHDDAVFVETEMGTAILTADGHWTVLGGQYLRPSADAWPLQLYFHYGLACLQRTDGTQCFVNKRGDVVREVDPKYHVTPEPDFPLWRLYHRSDETGLYLDRELNPIVHLDGSPVLSGLSRPYDEYSVRKSDVVERGGALSTECNGGVGASSAGGRE